MIAMVWKIHSICKNIFPFPVVFPFGLPLCFPLCFLLLHSISGRNIGFMAKILMHEHISVFSLSHRVFILLECINHFESSFLCYTVLLRLSAGVLLTQKHPQAQPQTGPSLGWYKGCGYCALWHSLLAGWTQIAVSGGGRAPVNIAIMFNDRHSNH